MRVPLGEIEKNEEALQEEGERSFGKLLCEKPSRKKPMKKLQKKVTNEKKKKKENFAFPTRSQNNFRARRFN
jgi:hypothetical protein